VNSNEPKLDSSRETKLKRNSMNPITRRRPNRQWSTPAISGVLGSDFQQFGGAIPGTGLRIVPFTIFRWIYDKNTQSK
jgi:hypothetical protein